MRQAGAAERRRAERPSGGRRSRRSARAAPAGGRPRAAGGDGGQLAPAVRQRPAGLLGSRGPVPLSGPGVAAQPAGASHDAIADRHSARLDHSRPDGAVVLRLRAIAHLRRDVADSFEPRNQGRREFAMEARVTATLSTAMFAFALLGSMLWNVPDSPPDHAAVHDEVLRRAQVWIEPSTPIEKAKLGENPPGHGAFAAGQVVDCRFKPGGVAAPRRSSILASRRREDQGEVRREQPGSVHGGRGQPAARRARLSHRPHVRRRAAALLRLPEDSFEVLQCVNGGRPIGSAFPALTTRAHRSSRRRSSSGRSRGGASRRRTSGIKWEELAKIDAKAGGATVIRSMRCACSPSCWSTGTTKRTTSGWCASKKRTHPACPVRSPWSRIWAAPSGPTNSISRPGPRRRSGPTPRPARCRCGSCRMAARRSPT